MNRIKYLFVGALITFGGVFAYNSFIDYRHQIKVLEQIVERLEAETRVAEVLVTGVNYDEDAKKAFTRIKFLEFDSKGQPLEPKYFTFSGNIIQFQSLVIRFDDAHIKGADRLKGKSAHLFWKVFMLDGKDTQEFEITPANRVPGGYRISKDLDPFEQELWEGIWEFALNSKKASEVGIKNAQIEAPGTMFVPGHIYTIFIEHDGGLTIKAQPVPEILKGETVIKG